MSSTANTISTAQQRHMTALLREIGLPDMRTASDAIRFCFVDRLGEHNCPAIAQMALVEKADLIIAVGKEGRTGRPAKYAVVLRGLHGTDIYWCSIVETGPDEPLALAVADNMLLRVDIRGVLMVLSPGMPNDQLEGAVQRARRRLRTASIGIDPSAVITLTNARTSAPKTSMAAVAA